MSKYSIKDLEVLSGIKAHTLRIWEQRYGLFSPQRTETNFRLYNDDDLKNVLNIALLNQNGHKISKIAGMSKSQLSDEVLQLTSKNLKYPDQIQALTVAMIDIDEARFEKVIARNILHLGLEKTMLHIVYPFLYKIGAMWQTGSITPAQEHFMSNLIRQKLIVAIDGQYNEPAPGAKKFLLFLPEGELHELSLLFSHYIIKSRQQKSIYLGQSLPLGNLVQVYDMFKPDFVVTAAISSFNQGEIQRFVNELSESLAGCHILMSGHQILQQSVELPANVSVLQKIDELVTFVDSI